MPTEYRILRRLKSGKLIVTEIWSTGWQVLTLTNEELQKRLKELKK